MKRFKSFMTEAAKKPETKVSRLEKAVGKLEKVAKKPAAAKKMAPKKPERLPSKWEDRKDPRFPRDPSIRVMAFGRGNPFHAGHKQVYDTAEKEALKTGGSAEFVLSRTHGDEHNPLDPETKLKHAKKAMPGANIKLADENHPSFMHQIKRAYDEGVRHLTVIGGGDRKHYEQLVKKYNGTPAAAFKFDSFKFVDAGKRGQGIVSGTAQRQHAASGDFESFRRGSANPKDWMGTREHFNDVVKALKSSKKKKKPKD